MCGTTRSGTDSAYGVHAYAALGRDRHADPAHDRRAPDLDATQARQRLVVAINVRIPVNKDDPPGSFLGEPGEGFSQLAKAVARKRDERVCLHQHHQACVSLGLLGTLVEPCHDDAHAPGLLAVAHVVVAAGNIEGDEHPALGLPAAVLAIPRRLYAEERTPAHEALERLLAVA